MRSLKKPAFAALIVIVIAVIYLLRFKGGDGFPVLAPGSYSGSIQFSAPLNDSNNLDFYVQNENGGVQPYILFANREWRFLIKENTYVAETPEGELVFSGAEDTPGAYTGIVKNTDGTQVATWSLQLISKVQNLQNVQEVQSLNQLLSLSSNLQEIESRISARQIAVEQQKNEIERLGEYLNEGQSLKTNADKKYQEKKAELDALKLKKETKLKEAETLREKFEISQRLFGIGKLVHLSRTAQEYEKRWFVSMYSSSAAETEGDFQTLVERAERIKTLKNEISYELNNFR